MSRERFAWYSIKQKKKLNPNNRNQIHRCFSSFITLIVFIFSFFIGFITVFLCLADREFTPFHSHTPQNTISTCSPSFCNLYAYLSNDKQSTILLCKYFYQIYLNTSNCKKRTNCKKQNPLNRQLCGSPHLQSKSKTTTTT